MLIERERERDRETDREGETEKESKFYGAVDAASARTTT